MSCCWLASAHCDSLLFVLVRPYLPSLYPYPLCCFLSSALRAPSLPRRISTWPTVVGKHDESVPQISRWTKVATSKLRPCPPASCHVPLHHPLPPHPLESEKQNHLRLKARDKQPVAEMQQNLMNRESQPALTPAESHTHNPNRIWVN